MVRQETQDCSFDSLGKKAFKQNHEQVNVLKGPFELLCEDRPRWDQGLEEGARNTGGDQIEGFQRHLGSKNGVLPIPSIPMDQVNHLPKSYP